MKDGGGAVFDKKKGQKYLSPTRTSGTPVVGTDC